MDYVDRLASFSRLIRCDPRGIGLSDPLPDGASTAESYADEIMAVLAGAGSERATLVGATYAGAGAILAAATHPERVDALVLINSYARLARSDDYPIGIPSRLLDLLRDATRPQTDGLRTGAGVAGDLPLMAPSLVGVDGAGGGAGADARAPRPRQRLRAPQPRPLHGRSHRRRHLRRAAVRRPCAVGERCALRR
jgi:pimeloyl-ACP methyl ester carboxylesterase